MFARSLEIADTKTRAMISIYDGVVGGDTMLASGYLNAGGNVTDGYVAVPIYVSCIVTPTPGSHTYNVGLRSWNGTGTVQLTASKFEPMYLLVEAL